MLWNWIVGVCFLITLSVIDYYTYKDKHLGIPSFISTSFLIIAFLMNPTNISVGVLALLISILFTDLELWRGTADTKVFVATGLLLSLQGILIYSLFVTLVSIFVKFVYVEKLKQDSMPFIPVLAISYVLVLFF